MLRVIGGIAELPFRFQLEASDRAIEYIYFPETASTVSPNGCLCAHGYLTTFANIVIVASRSIVAFYPAFVRARVSP